MLHKIITKYLVERYKNEFYSCTRRSSRFSSTTGLQISIFFDTREIRIRPEWDFQTARSFDYADPMLFEKLREVMDELGAVRRSTYAKAK